MSFNKVAAPISEIPKLRRYYFDAEFLDVHGEPSIFSVISIALIADQGDDAFYAISADFNPALVPSGHFVEQYVLPKLEPENVVPRLRKDQIRDGILRYVEPAETIEFWHYKTWGDRSALRHIFDGQEPEIYFRSWEKGNLVIRDMDQSQKEICAVSLPRHDEENKHHPKEDAKWLRNCVHHLDTLVQPAPLRLPKFDPEVLKVG